MGDEDKDLDVQKDNANDESVKGLDESIAMKSDRFTEEERASMLGSLSLYKDQSIMKTMEKNGVVDKEVVVVDEEDLMYSSSSSELTDDEEEQDDGDIKDTDGTEEKNVEKNQEKNKKNKMIKRRKKKKKK